MQLPVVANTVSASNIRSGMVTIEIAQGKLMFDFRGKRKIQTVELLGLSEQQCSFVGLLAWSPYGVHSLVTVPLAVLLTSTLSRGKITFFATLSGRIALALINSL